MYIVKRQDRIGKAHTLYRNLSLPIWSIFVINKINIGTLEKETETGTFDQISVKEVNYLAPWIGSVVNLTDEASMDRTFNTVDDVEPETKVAAAVDAAGVKEISHK